MAKNSKKNMVKRSEVIEEIGKQKGTPCQVIKGLYSYKGEETKKLNKVLPADAKDLCGLSSLICEEMNVGKAAMVRVKGEDGKAIKNEKGEYVLTEKKDAKGEVVLVKFTQSLLITWVLRHQGDELRNLCKKVREERVAANAAKSAEKKAAKAAATEEKAAA